MIVSVSGIQSLGEMAGVWGAFGAIWTAIAVAHTLYAPREVVLWNWRRTLLLGLSLALAAGNQFSLGVVTMAALLMMLWVAPVRKRAVFVIWGAACGVAMVICSRRTSFIRYCSGKEWYTPAGWISSRVLSLHRLLTGTTCKRLPAAVRH